MPPTSSTRPSASVTAQPRSWVEGALATDFQVPTPGSKSSALDAGEPKASGKAYVLTATLKQGIESDIAKKIAKVIRDEGPKGVQAQIQGDQLRVSGKKRDDLQAVIALLKAADLGVALQFTNYR